MTFNWDNYEDVPQGSLNKNIQQVQTEQTFNWDDYEDVPVENKPALPKQEENKPIYANNGTLTGGVNQNVKTYWDKKGRIHYENMDEKPNINWFEKQGRNIKTGLANFKNWLEETNPESQTYKEKANATLAAVTAPLGIGKQAAQWGAAKLTPFLGRKIAQSTVQGAGSGFVSGGTYGFGRGLIEGENPLKTAAQDAALATIGGTVIGFGGAKIGQKFAADRLRNANSLNKFKATNKYYQNYEQAVNPVRDDIGQVRLPSDGFKETLIQKPEKANEVIDLSKNIKNADYLYEETPKHGHKYPIEKFHRLQGENVDYLIAQNEKGKNYFHMVTDSNLTGPKPEGQNLPNNIINDIEANFNPKNEIINKKQLINSKNVFNQNIENLKPEKTQKTTISMSKQGRFWSKNIDDALTKDIQAADDEINSILQEIKRNPAIINDTEKLTEFENRLGAKTNFPDAELTESYYNRLYNGIAEAGNYNKVNNDYLNSEMLRASGEIKLSQLINNTDLPDEIAQAVKQAPPEYQVLHNADLQNQAAQTINNNASDVYGKLLDKISNKEAELNALEFEQGRQLLTKLYQENRLEEAVNLTENLAKKASKAGQAVQALSLWSKTTPEGAQLFAQKVLNKYNKDNNKNLKLTYEQAETIKDLANKVQNTIEGREQEIAIAELMKNIADLTPKSWNKKYDTYRYMNMLLSGKSRIKDFFLTGLNAADNAIDETIANGIDFLRTKLSGGQRAFNGLKPNEYLQGLQKGFKEGVYDVKHGINTARSGEIGRYGLPNIPSFNFKPVRMQSWESLKNNPITNSLNNILASGEKALNYTIQVPDRMFYEARYASSLADQMATAKVNVPTNEMIQQAQKEALEAVYQDNSWTSKLGNATRTGINEITGNFEKVLGLNDGILPKAGDFLMPFVTTPANIVNQGLKNTVGTVPGVIKLATAKNPQQLRDAEMLIAKNIKGLAPIAIGTGIGSGAIKSNIGSDDYQSDSITGLKPQSIVIGDKAFSLKDYPQWSIPMSIASGYAQDGMGQAILNAGQAVSDISALKTLGDLVGTVKGGYGQDLDASQIADNMIRTVGVNALTQNIPFGGALGELRNDIDPYARELYTPNTPDYVRNRVLNRLPFASQRLPQKYNAVGEPVYANNIQNPAARALSEAVDFGIRNYNENPTYNNYEQFKKDIADTDITGKSTVGFKKVPRSVKINGERIKLNNQQYSLYQRDFGRLNKEIKANLLNDKNFMQMSAGEQVKELNDWRKAVDQAVLFKLFGNVPRKWNKHAGEVYDYYYETEY